MQRRDFFKRGLSYFGYAVALQYLIACGDESEYSSTAGQNTSNSDQNPNSNQQQPLPGDASSTQQDSSTKEDPRAEEKPKQYVTVYDMYAVALYYDGSHGPKTGEIKAQYIEDGKDVRLEFWHGHGGSQHQFILKPEHYESLVNNKKTIVETTSVDGHKHTLFIDPTDPQYRIPGRQPREIEVYES